MSDELLRVGVLAGAAGGATVWLLDGMRRVFSWVVERLHEAFVCPQFPRES